MAYFRRYIMFVFSFRYFSVLKKPAIDSADSELLLLKRPVRESYLIQAKRKMYPFSRNWLLRSCGRRMKNVKTKNFSKKNDKINLVTVRRVHVQFTHLQSWLEYYIFVPLNRIEIKMDAFRVSRLLARKGRRHWFRVLLRGCGMKGCATAAPERRLREAST